MAYNKEGRKSRSSNKKRVVKYKASKGADFDDEGTGSGHITKSIKTKTKYDKKGEIKKIKRVKKTEGGGRMVTVSKPGIENNSLSPEGATGLVTTREKTNTAFDNPRAGSNGSKNRMKSMVDKIKNPQFKLERKAQKLVEKADKKGFDVSFRTSGAQPYDEQNPQGILTITKPSGKKTQIFSNKDEFKFGEPGNPTPGGESFLGISKSNRKGEWKKNYKLDMDSYRK